MIFLALPTYGTIDINTIFTVPNACKKYKQHTYAISSSFCTDSFNSCWCEMLNMQGIDYFAMVHSDVAGKAGWCDELLETLEAERLDILSVVLPIKDATGDTSTAILKEDGQVHRLSLLECHSLPKVFTAEDCEKIGHKGKLLLNTGMWIAKYGEWMKEFPGFHMESTIIKKEDGKYDTLNAPEDWNFSCWALSKGLKIAATTKIPAVHYGKNGWPNQIQV